MPITSGKTPHNFHDSRNNGIDNDNHHTHHYDPHHHHHNDQPPRNTCRRTVVWQFLWRRGELKCALVRLRGFWRSFALVVGSVLFGYRFERGVELHKRVVHGAVGVVALEAVCRRVGEGPPRALKYAHFVGKRFTSLTEAARLRNPD